MTIKLKILNGFGGGSGGGGTSDYTQLSNKPKINNVTLTGNKTSADLGLISTKHYFDNNTGTTLDTQLTLGNVFDVYKNGQLLRVGATYDYTVSGSVITFTTALVSTDTIRVDVGGTSATSGLATVATSGSYNDLSNKPTIPTKTSDISNDSGFITSSVNNLTNYNTKPTTINSTDTVVSFSSASKVAQNANYVYSNALTSLTFGASSIDTTFVETTLTFTVGSGFAFSYLDSGVEFAGGVPTLESGKKYTILISNNVIYTSSAIELPTA